ncbi:hypothetical protein ABBQ32_010306 [Trebouxia sp. C0010 RCD-2024]
MHNSLQNFTPPLSRFRNKEIQENQNMGLPKVQAYAKLFRHTFQLAIEIFGPDVFRKWGDKKFTWAAVDVSFATQSC